VNAAIQHYAAAARRGLTIAAKSFLVPAMSSWSVHAKILLDAIRRYQNDGNLSFTEPAVDFSRIRSISFAYPRGQDWRQIDPFDPPRAEAA